MILMFNFAKEMCFVEKAPGNKSTRDILVKRLLQSPAIMAGSLKMEMFSEAKTRNPKESNTRCLSSDPNELCIRLKLPL